MEIFTNEVGKTIDSLIKELGNPKVFVVSDINTHYFVVEKLIKESEAVANATQIKVKSGDINKNLTTLTEIWRGLTEGGATRSSVVVNVGGGVVTDMGAFAASTFKRGIRFINVPTSLLAAVDASVGGKTGINFLQYKNEVGLFSNADAVIISSKFFGTLPDEELLSGFAEMIKHALIDSPEALHEILATTPSKETFASEKFLEILEKSVDVKRRIVEADPTEKGLRKALNFGHTIGHAFETFALKKGIPIPHGYAVAWGMLAELMLSHLVLGYPTSDIYPVGGFIKEHYGKFAITCADYAALLEIMSHDKKNSSPNMINFTLLKAPGDPQTDCVVAPDDIKNALDLYCDF